MSIWDTEFEDYVVKFMKNPSDLVNVQNFYEVFTENEGALKVLEDDLLGDPEFEDLYRSWYVSDPYTLEDLLSCPKGSLGHVYGTHIKENNLDLQFITEFKGRDIQSYLWCRAAHVHDIFHVITGYDTSVAGELALKAFEVAQYKTTAGTCILGAGMVALATQAPQMLHPMMGAIVDGYQKGLRYPLLMKIKFDKEFNTPIDDFRAKYKIPSH